MMYSIVALAPLFLASASALAGLDDVLKPVTDAVQGVQGVQGAQGTHNMAEPPANALGINLKAGLGLDIGPAEETANDGGINVNLLGTNINAKVCLGVEVPPLLSALVDIGCPSSPPPSDDHTHVWHPSHPGVYIDDCDDDEATEWHYVHHGQPKNPDQGHYVWTATAAPAATHTVVQGGNQYTSVEVAESTTVCAVPAPSGYVPPATQVYVPLTPAVPAATSVAPVVPAYTQSWETQVKVPAMPTATPVSGSGAGAPWYGAGSGAGAGAGSGSGSGSGYASPSDSGSGAAAGTPAPGVCPGPNCPPGASTVVIPVVPIPSGTHEGPTSETPGVSTPVVTAGASRNVAGVFAIIFAAAALL